ncbi:hypothetical protein TNCV_3195371 [Trichonephila clavipes]|uniref:Uncharacterized protein n=1 Tax=Trichonephila clavipes TaxID=2585209 RepID=A0A8X6V2F9_TRICX|nr:hypothetical protein TNCV_3195371 [Trichonephila clavipes]
MGEDYRPSRRWIFLSRNRSSCAAEQFYSDASLEAVDLRAPNNSKNWKWTTALDDRHLLLMAVNDRTASYRQLAVRWLTCTNVGFVNSSTSAVPWIACRGAFIQEPSNGKPSTVASAMGS